MKISKMRNIIVVLTFWAKSDKAGGAANCFLRPSVIRDENDASSVVGDPSSCFTRYELTALGF